MELLYLARSGLPDVSHEKNVPESHIINPLIYWPSLFSQDGWILALLFFCKFIDQHAKKELGQYPAILNSRLVNNPYVWAIGVCGSKGYGFSAVLVTNSVLIGHLVIIRLWFLYSSLELGTFFN